MGEDRQYVQRLGEEEGRNWTGGKGRGMGTGGEMGTADEGLSSEAFK